MSVSEKPDSKPKSAPLSGDALAATAVPDQPDGSSPPPFVTDMRARLSPDDDALRGPALFPKKESGERLSPLVAELTETLEKLELGRSTDPFTNPVLLLSLDLSKRLERGQISYGDLEQLTQYLSTDGMLERAARLRRYLGETDPDQNRRHLSTILQTLSRAAGVDGGERVPFEQFKALAEREYFGLVITAHPTFNLSTPLMRALADLAVGRGGDGAPLTADQADKLLTLACRSEHSPDADISLSREHALSMEAIVNIQSALREVYDGFYRVAAESYPDRWTEASPRLMTIASWVGYDLDGRSDILWSDSLQKRLKLQALQFQHYLEEVRALHSMAGPEARDLLDTLDLIESRIALALSQVTDEIAALDAAAADPANERARIRALSKRMYDSRALRLTDARSLIDMADRAILKARERLNEGGQNGAPTDPDAAGMVLIRRLCILRAEFANHGLGLAHTHVRINSTQMHNSIRKAVGLVTDPNDPRYRVSYLDKINALLADAKPVSINFGSVVAERTSAKRLFMVLAQMLKYCDSTAPIRFLIAESESAFTCLAALYYAKLFGVEEHIDISPLFETEKALEAGSRMIEQLLDNPHYLAYVKQRGRICIQTGYSDAGRYLGQTPAAASIERLRLRLVTVMARRGLHDIQLLIFDTHGESIGRGGHPAGFEDRLSYIDTAASRGYMADKNVAFKQEMSFQGGDGYLMFVNPTSALAAVTRILEHSLRTGDNSNDDPFYDESAYIREFFTTVKEFQVGLMKDGNYGVLLSAFGANLLFQSGSRAFKRQHEDPSKVDEAHPSQFRAIPHNGVLQQLGLLANSIGGVGAAIAKDPEKFADLYPRSPRLRQLMGIVEYGCAASDPDVMKAYIDSLDPGLWLLLAASTGPRERQERLLRLAGHLEQTTLHERKNRVFRQLYQDFTVLERSLGLVDTGYEGCGPEGCGGLISTRSRLHMRLLHAIRLTAIHEIFVLAMQIPEFSSRHAITPQEVVIRLLHLDVPAVVELLREVFPLTSDDDDRASDYGEPATYAADDSQDYQYENDVLFGPMEGLHRLIRRISSATTQHIGFLG
ncbi:phosphoenolpyruvate carboxylase [Fodinicurvata sp. EGI_FJ10296]|uniref:phosphoenolpyruvate carboxylase n=1 Tax=Fodinicurvata sp. EGI_FJ10296 TaxID=3231908 RepID=UPI0034517F2B